MTESEYIIFCDESDVRGKYFSNFYGGLIVGASQYERVTLRLNETKQKLNFLGEVKWEKVTERYLPKYEDLIRIFFEEIAKKHVKVRIMFRQNTHQAKGLSAEQVAQEYFILYYQFIKHGFGLEFLKPLPEGTKLRLYFDQFPDTKEKIERFKGFLIGLQESRKFRAANIRINKEDVTEIRSHDHVLLQCLDIVLGAITFRLNNKHKEKLPGLRIRGKRTRAKERLYKTILQEIRKIRPGLNIGISTGTINHGKWENPYLHWRFIPKEFEYQPQFTKKKK